MRQEVQGLDSYMKEKDNIMDYLRKNNYYDKIEDKCLHLSCPDCKGTGINQFGRTCVHYISCPCPRCTISF